MEGERKWRKKPVEIEAYQFNDKNSAEIILAWANGAIGYHVNSTRDDPNGGMLEWLTISTLEGEMTARKGDWIIKGVEGEFYPCKPDIFEATYERASCQPLLRKDDCSCVSAANVNSLPSAQQSDALTTQQAQNVQKLVEAWTRYKLDMRPETRNEYLRASSKVFDEQAIAPFTANKE